MNYLELGDLLVDRLSTQIPSVTNVMASVDLQSISSQALITPALYVFYTGDDLGSAAGKGIAYEIKQTWSVVIVVKNLSPSESYRRAELGNLIGEVIKAVQGWKPSTNYSQMYRENAPAPSENPGGYVYFQLYFSSKLLTMGE